MISIVCLAAWLGVLGDTQQAEAHGAVSKSKVSSAMPPKFLPHWDRTKVQRACLLPHPTSFWVQRTTHLPTFLHPSFA